MSDGAVGDESDMIDAVAAVDGVVAGEEAGDDRNLNNQEPPASDRSAAGGIGSVGVAFAVALVVVAADQATKAWARSRLADGDKIDLGLLDLNLVFNTGASFGFGSQIGPFIGSVAAIVAVGLLIYSRTIASRFAAGILGAIAGGAFGNVLDRVFRSNPSGESGFMRGAVIDFIDLRWWPVFNIADMAVVCGAVLMVLFSLRED